MEVAKFYRASITLLTVIEEFKLPFSAEYGLCEAESHNELLRRVIESLNKASSSIAKKHMDLKIDARVEEEDPSKIISEIAGIVWLKTLFLEVLTGKWLTTVNYLY